MQKKNRIVSLSIIGAIGLASISTFVFQNKPSVLLEDEQKVVRKTHSKTSSADKSSQLSKNNQGTTQPFTPQDRSVTKGSTLMEVPDRPPVIDREEHISLWDADPQPTKIDGVKAFSVNSKPALGQHFKLKQTLDIYIPQRNEVLKAELKSTHNMNAKVAIWKGKILEGDASDNIIVAVGPLETHITVATETGTYTAIVDNASGKGTIVDQGDINARQSPIEDGIPIRPINISPPT